MYDGPPDEFTPAGGGPIEIRPTNYIWSVIHLEVPRPTLRARLIGFRALIGYAFTAVLFAPSMGWTKDGPPPSTWPGRGD